MKLLQFPLVKVTIGFVIGLLIAYYSDFGFLIGLSAIVSAFLLFITCYYFYKRPLLFGISTLLLSVSIGLFTWIIHSDVLHKNHYVHLLSDQQQSVNLTLDTKLKPNKNYLRYYAKVNEVDNQNSLGKLLINIDKNLYQKEPEIGTNFLVYAKILPNTSAKNPGQFDYGNYLEKQKVYAQIYTDSVNIQKLQTQKTAEYYAYKIRKRIVDNFRKSKFSEEELAVLHALILGQQQDISPEILQAYQYAGAVHILSVSGLHVAYIYLFLNFILKFFPNNRRTKFIKLVILLLSLWSFAFLAGLAPAIVRAVVMFSFVSVGTFLTRNTNIIYTLCISMLVILLCNPSFLFDVGFQLSYLALFFIVWTKPMMDRFYTPKNKVQKYFWETATVSLAAQIGVLPLSLYYFNQFPTLFIITNLLVLLPLSVFMIYGVVLSLLAFFGLTNFYLSKLLEFGIWYINQVSFQVAKFEGFVFKDVSFSISMLIGWYLLIFSFFIWLNSRKYYHLKLLLSSVVLLQSIYIFSIYTIKNSSEFIVFNRSKSTLIAERSGNKIRLYSNDTLLEKDLLVKSYRVGISSEVIKIDSLQNYYFPNQIKVLMMDNSAVYQDQSTPDVLILTGSPKFNLERFIHKHQPEIIIADGSNYKSYVALWKQTCEKHKIRFHSTYENGFYRIGY